MSGKIIQILETGDYTSEITGAARILREGGLVVIPTETVYGIAGSLDIPEAVGRLKQIRGNDEAPLTIHLAEPGEARDYIGDVSELGTRMMRKLWPGPVGLIFDVDPKTRGQVAQKLGIVEEDIYQDGAITLRCPDHNVANDVLRAVADKHQGHMRPVVAITVNARSARADGWVSLAEKVDLILDAGLTRYSKPSTLVKVTGDRFQIVRPGVYDERIIEKLLKTTILFVCSGNTCRSAMAEGLARKILAEKLGVGEDQLGEKGFVVQSAGAFATPGMRAAAPGISVLRKMGVDISRHRSQLLSVELIHQSDAIFAMSENHRRSVLALVPSAAEKVHLLDPAGDIDDPIGGDESLYLSLAGQLNTLIANRLAEMKLW